MLDIDGKRQVLRWGLSCLKDKGYGKPISEPHVVVDTHWSYLISLKTSKGCVYLKAMPEMIALEPAIIEKLQRVFEAKVPTIIDVNQDLSCFLMADAGQSLRSVLKKTFDEDLVSRAIEQFVHLQIATASRLEPLLEIGVPDWRLDKMPGLFKEFLQREALLLADGVLQEEIASAQNYLPKVAHWCELLAQYPVPASISQPDCNDNNTLVDLKTQVITTIDLGEVVISHPFFSLHNMLYQAKKHHAQEEGTQVYRKLHSACFKRFQAIYKDEQSLKHAIKIAGSLFYVYWLLSNDRLIQACGQKNILTYQPGRMRKELQAFLVTCQNDRQ